MDNTPWKEIASSLKDGKDNSDTAKWRSENSINDHEYSKIKELWQLLKSAPPSIKTDVRSDFRLVQNRIKRRESRARVGIRRYLAAAAILILGLTIGALTSTMDGEGDLLTSQYLMKSGQKGTVILPDGTVIDLNGDSKLTYNSNYNVDNRAVSASGKLFFDVTKSKDKPFIADIGYGLSIRVLGTSFSVNTDKIADENRIEIALLEGNIMLCKGDEEVTTLSSGELLIYDRDNDSYNKTNIDVEQYTCWRKESLSINDKNLAVTLNQIALWYGVDLELDFKGVDNNILSFDIKSENLNDIMYKISKVTDIKYRIESDKLIVWN